MTEKEIKIADLVNILQTDVDIAALITHVLKFKKLDSTRVYSILKMIDNHYTYGIPLKEEVKRYKKIPIIIKAIKFNGENYQEIQSIYPNIELVTGVTGIRLKIPTLEGPLYACRGDYIIEGIKEELYPCKPCIFKQTYEEVKEDDH